MFFLKKARVSGPPDYIVAGLGNPGRKYETTRHNSGYMFIDCLADKYSCEVKKIKFKALTETVEISGKKCLLMKPSTFMNNSGESIREAASFYKIPPENILVIFDDISLPVGKMRIRRKGSDGGHNGIKSIIYHLKSDEFPRIKLGVGEKPNPDYDLADWVLSSFSQEDIRIMREVVKDAVSAAEMIIAGDTDRAMSKYNS